MESLSESSRDSSRVRLARRRVCNVVRSGNALRRTPWLEPSGRNCRIAARTRSKRGNEVENRVGVDIVIAWSRNSAKSPSRRFQERVDDHVDPYDRRRIYRRIASRILSCFAEITNDGAKVPLRNFPLLRGQPPTFVETTLLRTFLRATDHAYRFSVHDKNLVTVTFLI